MSTKEKTGRTPGKPQKKTEKEAPRPLEDVVYMPPKPFMRNRLLLRLATVAAIVLALVLAMSVFFRVEHIQVSGLEQYTAWDISQASGIKQGDSLFSLGLPGAAARIKELYPQTAIIFLTAYKEYAYDAYAVHPSGYLLKPVSRVISSDSL